MKRSDANNTNTEYLGDGAYLTINEHNDFVVWTERQDGLHFVCLDAIVLNNIGQIARALHMRKLQQ